MGDLHTRGGRIEERKLQCSPVPSSRRRPSTGDFRTSIGPPPVTSERVSAVSVADIRAMPVFVDLVGQAQFLAIDLDSRVTASIRFAPSPISSSSPLDSSALAGCSTCTLRIGVPFCQRLDVGELLLVKQEGTPRLRSDGASTDLVWLNALKIKYSEGIALAALFNANQMTGDLRHCDDQFLRVRDPTTHPTLAATAK